MTQNKPWLIGLVRILISKWLAVYMGGATGRFPGRGVKQNLAMHVYISYFFSSVYMERIFLGRFSPRPGKSADNFYHINTPSRFVGTILCWVWKLSQVKSSRLETFSCKLGLKNVAGGPCFLYYSRVEHRDQHNFTIFKI